MRRLVYVLSVVLVLAAALVVPLPYGEQAPGDAVAVSPIVGGAGELNGDILLLTVTVSQPSVLAVVRAAIDPDRDIVPRSDILAPEDTRRDHLEQQLRVFRDANRVAAAVGARAAGVPTALQLDVLVEQVVVGGPADGLLAAGDVIVAVDGERVVSATRLSERTRDLGAGADLVVTVERDGTSIDVPVRTGQVRGMSRAGIGITVQDVVAGPELPDGITLDEDTGIGGPSAGLAVALAVYDLLADTDLAAGRAVAVTGTIDLDGTVGSIGGLQQKLVGARRAGAEVIVVPAAQLDQARDLLDGVDVTLLGVTDLDDAIQQLVS